MGLILVFVDYRQKTLIRLSVWDLYFLLDRILEQNTLIEKYMSLETQ
uniref:Uncharacterized protein n=1 Tax=virus sp. ctBM815 TaxID=2825806 RepID=A0A8S5RJK1_9VIRU|nr:MAG TPA: hypothetical protein [virus sp. ctBM815]